MNGKAISRDGEGSGKSEFDEGRFGKLRAGFYISDLKCCKLGWC